jgi:hypothetical protein
VNSEEWAFFLKGGSVLDRSQQTPNPAPLWISAEAWDNITVSHSMICCLPLEEVMPGAAVKRACCVAVIVCG